MKPKVNKHAPVSRRWLRDILAALYRIRPATRADVASHAKLNNASVSRGLQQLDGAGIIRKVGKLDSRGGRPREVISLEPSACTFIAMDLEGVTVRCTLTDLLGNFRLRWEEQVSLGQALPVERVFAGIDVLLRDATPAQRERVQAIGVSFPGLLDEQGCLTAVNLGWHDVPLERLLTERYRLPVFLERDEATCIRAERSHGLAKQARDWMYLIVSNGIGVGFVVDGRHVSGHTKMSGELGHVTVDPHSTIQCQCGKYGCLETIASTPAILRQYGELTGSTASSLACIRLAEIFERARRGEVSALAVVKRAAEALGFTLSYAVNLLNPELILLGGDIVCGQDLILPWIRSEIARHALPQLASAVSFAVSDLGPDIRLRGAASLAFHRCLRDPSLLARLCRIA
ncbi:MAG TPA: ROK family protein [Bryobacteraceae bacterium]|nr:ROK family protein [Bryobacteraceae bacterium]